MSLFTLVVSVIVIGASFALLICQKTRRQDSNEELLAWLENFSLDAYAPLDYLLNEEHELALLPSQSEGGSDIANELRSERRAIARRYLRCLTSDFQRMMHIAKLMVLYGQDDRSSLATSLWHNEMTFYCSITMAHLRLTTYPLVKQWNSSPVLSHLASLYENIQPAGPPVQIIPATD